MVGIGKGLKVFKITDIQSARGLVSTLIHSFFYHNIINQGIFQTGNIEFYYKNKVRNKIHSTKVFLYVNSLEHMHSNMNVKQQLHSLSRLTNIIARTNPFERNAAYLMESSRWRLCMHLLGLIYWVSSLVALLRL